MILTEAVLPATFSLGSHPCFGFILGSTIRFRAKDKSIKEGEVVTLLQRSLRASDEDGLLHTMPYRNAKVVKAAKMDWNWRSLNSFFRKRVDEYRDRFYDIVKLGKGGKWNVKYSLNTGFAGITLFSDRTISLSVPFCMVSEREKIEDTVLHEIAHAMAGIRAGHGLQWWVVAREIGCDATKCTSAPLPPKWIGECGCGNQWKLQKAPSKSYRRGKCRKCWNVIKWRKVG